ncbi:MAG: mechanosensitive ion channel, partial [Clostridiales bacterium]|nr:mechanosensitive ion channel [Clostridiales bacterium]
MDFEQLLNNVVNWLTTEGLKIVIGLFVLYIGFKAINIVCRRIEKGLHKKEVDLTISTVVMSTLRKVLKVLAVICFIGYIGIETSSIAAAITSAGVAIGLALQGSLANFA